MKQIPVQVQQMIDEVNNPSNSVHIKHNYITSLENIRDRLNVVIEAFNKKHGRR